MGEIVSIKPADLADNHELITDMCRFSEKILTEAEVRKRWKFVDDKTWEALGENDALVEKIEAEKLRRIRSGATKRERAQALVVDAPAVVAKIMLDDTQNSRHRLDAAGTLDKLAQNPQENSAAASAGLFQITINLGNDCVEHYSKTLSIGTEDDAAPANYNSTHNRPAVEWSPEQTAPDGALTLENLTPAQRVALAALMERG